MSDLGKQRCKCREAIETYLIPDLRAGGVRERDQLRVEMGKREASSTGFPTSSWGIVHFKTVKEHLGKMGSRDRAAALSPTEKGS